MTYAQKILSFFSDIHFSVQLPEGVEVMHPFSNTETWRVCQLFYNKYYNSNNRRYSIIGINPGRFGGGITGIPFTDPVRLDKVCGIENSFPLKHELSSVFVYEMIHAFGGAESFYNQFYFTSVSPLGFTKGGKNLNYYDDKVLAERIVPFAIDCFRKQINWGMHTSIAFCLGEGANYKFLSKLNQEHKLFEKIIPLSHPRFIMQYKLKTKHEYIDKYLQAFQSCLCS